jgi:hypothetical protein
LIIIKCQKDVLCFANLVSLNSKVPYWKRNQKNNSLDKTKQQQSIDFLLVGPLEVGVSMPYSLFDVKKKQILKVNN